MAYISTDLIKPGSFVSNTFIHVFNHPDNGNNVEVITLEFNDGKSIEYSTELKLDLPNGTYRLMDGRYVEVVL